MNANAAENIARGAGWCALTLGLLIAGWLLLTDSRASIASSYGVSNGVQHASHSKRAKALTSTRNIQDIRVGDRVIAHNPNVSEEERQAFAEPDWSRWLKLTLELPKKDGQICHIEMLRSEQWLLERCSFLMEPVEEVEEPATIESLVQGQIDNEFAGVNSMLNEMSVSEASSDWVPLAPVRPWIRELALANMQAQQAGYSMVGIVVELDLEEMGASGPAFVTNIECCPTVEDSDGRVVTSTFRHAPSHQILDVTFEGESEAMGVTDNHPFWSVDEQVFMPIGEMKVGDLVQTFHGDTKRIESKLPRPGPETVYNMEVWGEHVYFVGEQGLLAHNTCDDFSRLAFFGDRDRPGFVDVTPEPLSLFGPLLTRGRFGRTGTQVIPSGVADEILFMNIPPLNEFNPNTLPELIRLSQPGTRITVEGLSATSRLSRDGLFGQILQAFEGRVSIERNTRVVDPNQGQPFTTRFLELRVN